MAAAVIESLEPRVMLSSNTYIVTTLVDSNATGYNGQGGNPLSLRQAIYQADTAANAGSNSDTEIITFTSSLSGTLTLSGSALRIVHTHAEIDIDGPGASVLAIDGNNQTGDFSIASLPGSSVKISSVAAGDHCRSDFQRWNEARRLNAVAAIHYFWEYLGPLG